MLMLIVCRIALGMDVLNVMIPVELVYTVILSLVLLVISSSIESY